MNHRGRSLTHRIVNIASGLNKGEDDLRDGKRKVLFIPRSNNAQSPTKTCSVKKKKKKKKIEVETSGYTFSKQVHRAIVSYLEFSIQLVFKYSICASILVPAK